MSNPVLAQFLQRIPPQMTGLHNDVKTVFSIVDRFSDRSNIIKRDPTLSATGVHAKLNEALESGPRLHLRQISEKTAKAIESVKARRANLMPTPPKDDLIGELRRAELRTFLRSMEQGERLKSALSGSPEIEEAIIHGPAALSGLTEEIKGRIVDRYVERIHGPALANLAAEAEALEVTLSAVATATHLLSRETQVEGVAA